MISFIYLFIPPHTSPSYGATTSAIFLYCRVLVSIEINLGVSQYGNRGVLSNAAYPPGPENGQNMDNFNRSAGFNFPERARASKTWWQCIGELARGYLELLIVGYGPLFSFLAA